MDAVKAFFAFDSGKAGYFCADKCGDFRSIAVDFYFFLFDGAVWVNVGLPLSFYEHLCVDKWRSSIQKHSADIHRTTPFGD